MKFLDLFSGIGGFRLGMEMAGHECVGYVEWDKSARKSYEAMHSIEGEWTWHDISTIDYRQLPRADMWTFGFPCQDISIANNKRKGFSGNRSSYFFAVTKRLRQIKEWDSERRPSVLLIENVKNFLSVNNGWDFLATQIELDEIGYDTEWSIINSSEHGVAQNRERVYIVGHYRERKYKQIFPISKTTTGFLRSIQADTSGKGLNSQQDRFYRIDGVMCTLPKARAKTKCCVVDEKGNFMILTAKERMRLQGFPDEYTERALTVTSENDLCEQAGNSVTVNVVYEIAKRLSL